MRRVRGTLMRIPQSSGLHFKFGFTLNLGGAGVVEIEKMFLILSIADAHGGPRVLIQDAGDDVRD